MEVRVHRHCLAALATGKNAGNRYIEGWVGLNFSMDVIDKKKIFYPCRYSKPGPSIPLRRHGRRK